MSDRDVRGSLVSVHTNIVSEPSSFFDKPSEKSANVTADPAEEATPIEETTNVTREDQTQS